MTETFGESEWTVSDARQTVHELRRIATGDQEYDAIELFLALCEYLDELHGTDATRGRYGFGSFSTGAQLDHLAAAVQAVRGPNTAWDPTSNRMDQPVNAAVTLAQGRELTEWMTARPAWERQVGLCLRALYAYLDQLYGGPGLFNQLLTPRERERVAAR
ncbi:hypothetical protein [Kribbella sp.]|uniref:hypothetical protein n=1 Tax=Kribbella sp. TaxID=1871183 RepID=UPI002D49951E|nr:hypothetical protein [Kribbella sp.]HZX08124.1 hypothetical protein [Kribbella sp.]